MMRKKQRHGLGSWAKSRWWAGWLAGLGLMSAQGQTPVMEFGLESPSRPENGGVVTLTVVRSPAQGESSVDYGTVDGTAVSGADYVGQSGTVRFTNGQAYATIEIGINDDGLLETEETFRVELTNPVGGVLGQRAVVTVTIFDNDAEFRVSSMAVVVREDGTNAQVEVCRSASLGSAQVSFYTVDGTAVGGVDYVGTNGTLVFSNGQSCAQVTIPILNDCVIETNAESFEWVLTNAINGSIGAGGERALITIVSDDTAAGTIQFWDVLPSDDVLESAGQLTVRVDRLCGTNGAVSVRYRAVIRPEADCPGTTFASSSDFTLGGDGTLSWADGDGSLKSFTVTITEDDLVELDEWIELELYQTSGGAVLGNRRVERIRVRFTDQPAGAAERGYNRPSGLNPNPGANSTVRVVSVITNGPWAGMGLIGGDFTAVNGVVRNGIARITANGATDPTFDPGTGADGSVNAIGVQADGRIVVGGGFTSFNNVSRRGVARLLPGGALDGSFDVGSGTDGAVRALGLQADGKVVIGGDFTSVNAYGRGHVARLNADGSVDASFDPGLGTDGPVYALAVQTDAKVVIGGMFSGFGTNGAGCVGRLNGDGSWDRSFAPMAGADGPVYALAVQADGKVLVGGAFGTFDGVSRNGIARLNGDGSLDETFDPGTGALGPVYDIKVQGDGRVIIVGDFIAVNGTVRNRMARLHPDGTLDTSFLDPYDNQYQDPPGVFWAGADQFVSSCALQPDGQILIGGGFTRLGGDEWNSWSPSNVVTRFFYGRIVGGTTPPPYNEPGNVEFVSAGFSVDENTQTGVVTLQLRRRHGRVGDVSVHYATVDDTAVAGVDYVGVTGTVRWPHCSVPEEIRFLTIPILDNTNYDGNRNFRVVLSEPFGSGAEGPTLPSLGFQRETVVSILDNDLKHGVITFDRPIYTVGENGGSAVITVVRTNGSAGKVTVRYATSNGSAVAGSGAGADYGGVTNVLTFQPGETNKTFTVPILNDTAVEFEETVNLRLYEVSGGATLGLTNATLLIWDNDNGRGSLSFERGEFRVVEGTDPSALGTTWATVTVRRTSGSVGSVGVTAQVFELPPGPGMARASVDFGALTTNLVFNAGETSKTFMVAITPDFFVEGDERLGLRLTNATGGANLGFLSAGTLAIVDDDAYGRLGFAGPDFFVSERATNAVITVVRTDGSADEVSVDYVVEPGTASAPGDFTPVAGTLVFSNGVRWRSFSIPIADDNELEFNETVLLRLTNFAKAGPGLNTVATLVITDDEALNVPAGTVDTVFSPGTGPNDAVQAVAVQRDQRLVIAGAFTSFNGMSRNRIARLNADATLDATFNPGPGADGPIRALLLQPDGRMVVGGDFTAFGATNRNHVARLMSDGRVDVSFNPGSGTDNPVFALAQQPDGRLLVGGGFAAYNGFARRGLVRVHTNGLVDASFDVGTGINGTVYALAVQGDGKILVGGSFSQVNGQPRNHLVRLTADGALDPTFNAGAGPNEAVRAIAVQFDGRILIGGSFTNYDGARANYLARLLPDGPLDPTFNPGSGPDNAVLAIVVRTDERILIGGSFATYNGMAMGRLARLTPAGAVDPSINFGSGADNFIASVAVQSDDGIVVGGGFTSFNGMPFRYVARLVGGYNFGSGSFEISPRAWAVEENVTNVTVRVIRTGGLFGAAAVEYFTGEGSGLPNPATPGSDYGAVSGRLEFREGENARTFSIPIINDTEVEPAETVLLVLTNASGGATITPPPEAALTIENLDSRLDFAQGAWAVGEDVVGGQAVLGVVRSGATNNAVSASYVIVPGTAVAGEDYLGLGGVVVFGPGETQAVIRVPIVNDLLVEGNEQFTVRLVGAAGEATLGRSNAVVTIVDNDFAPGELSFAAATYLVSEGAGQVRLEVVRRGGSTGTVSVNYASRDGAAQAGADYLPVSGELTFGDGETNKAIVVSVVNDGLVEEGEDFWVTLSGVQGGAVLVEPVAAVVTIVDQQTGSGAVDTRFDPGLGAGDLVRALAVQADGRIVVGGAFTNFDGRPRGYVARLNPNGSLDTAFLAGPGAGADGMVSTVGLFPNGKVVVGGAFGSVNSVARNRLAVLTTNGAVDSFFVPPTALNAAAYAGLPMADGKLFIGGGFGNPVSGVGRLKSSGQLDVSFDPGAGADGVVFCLALQTNGLSGSTSNVQLLVGGEFRNVGSLPRRRLARLSLDGALDLGFSAVIEGGPVFAVLGQPDGKVVIGGAFTNVNGQRCGSLARLNGDGTLDSSFAAAQGTGFNGPVYALALHGDGRLLLGGNFTLFNATDGTNGQPRNRLARVLPDGTLDPNFGAGLGANDAVYALALQPDGQIVIGGEFTRVYGFERRGVARLNADPVPAFRLLDRATSPVFDLVLNAQPGQLFVLETSTDLVTWRPERTNRATGSAVIFTVTNNVAERGRFYRATRPGP